MHGRVSCFLAPIHTYRISFPKQSLFMSPALHPHHSIVSILPLSCSRPFSFPFHSFVRSISHLNFPIPRPCVQPDHLPSIPYCQPHLPSTPSHICTCTPSRNPIHTARTQRIFSLSRSFPYNSLMHFRPVSITLTHPRPPCSSLCHQFPNCLISCCLAVGWNLSSELLHTRGLWLRLSHVAVTTWRRTSSF